MEKLNKIIVLCLFMLPGLAVAGIDVSGGASVGATDVEVSTARISYSGTVLQGPEMSESAAFMLCGDSKDMADACLGLRYTRRATGSNDPESWFLTYEVHSNTLVQFYGSYGVDPIAGYKRIMDNIFPGSTDPGYVYRAEFGVRYKVGNLGVSLAYSRIDGFGSVSYYNSTQAAVYWYLH